MAKGGRTKNKSKRSTIPRGIPQKRSGGGSGGGNNNNKGNNNVISPFEYARTTNSSSRVKHHVHNKSVSGSSSAKHQQSALAKSIARRKHLLKSKLETQHKSNEFVDRRIGEAGKQQRYNGDDMYDDNDGKQRRENAMLKRIVAERVRRSKRAGKFSLEDDNDDSGGLTHRVSLLSLVYLSFSGIYNISHDNLSDAFFVHASHSSIINPLTLFCHLHTSLYQSFNNNREKQLMKPIQVNLKMKPTFSSPTRMMIILIRLIPCYILVVVNLTR